MTFNALRLLIKNRKSLTPIFFLNRSYAKLKIHKFEHTSSNEKASETNFLKIFVEWHRKNHLYPLIVPFVLLVAYFNDGKNYYCAM